MLHRQDPRTDADLGVLLLNFGGPQTLADVRPFLFNLFSDPDIIRIKSDGLRRAIAWVIATTRQRKSRRLYQQIGGGSPLRAITEAQAAALRALLADRGCRARVYIGMRCWQPSIDEAVAQVAADPVGQLVVLPLFPQFSIPTTGSCLNYFRAVAEKAKLPDRMDIFCIPTWFEEPLYLEAVVKQIREAQERFSNRTPSEIHLLYSAHSIPARYIEEGDPYLKQTRKTVELIDERLGGRFPSTLAFQSKVGPVKWLGPATPDVLAQLGRRGISRVLVVPVSFVSDHIETLQEIDIEYRKLAQKAGIREFHRASSLNTDPGFIEALAHITLKRIHTK
jgi:ferrochelatase